MPTKEKSSRGYKTPVLFRLVGDYSTAPIVTQGSPMVMPYTGIIQSPWAAPCGLCISDFRLVRATPSGAQFGQTMVELWRYRMGLWTLLVTCVLPAGAGPMAQGTVAPTGPSPELRTLWAGDILVCRLVDTAVTSREGAGVSGLTCQVEFR